MEPSTLALQHCFWTLDGGIYWNQQALLNENSREASLCPLHSTTMRRAAFKQGQTKMPHSGLSRGLFIADPVETDPGITRCSGPGWVQIRVTKPSDRKASLPFPFTRGQCLDPTGTYKPVTVANYCCQLFLNHSSLLSYVLLSITGH